MPVESAGKITVHELSVSPWLLMLAVLLPLILLMWWRKIFPTSRLAFVAMLPLAMSLAIPWLPDLWWYFIAAVDVSIVVIALIDLWTLPDHKHIQVARSMPRVASLDKPHPVEIAIDNRSKRLLRMRLSDDASDHLTLDPPVHIVRIEPGKRVSVQHTVVSHRRGSFLLENIYCQIGSLLGLWRRQHVFISKSELHVYPDIKQISEYALLARTNRLTQIGVRRTRRPGQENEFERLRDYQPDDNYKHIDWRSTARRQKATVRTFQTDQSQRVIFLLDCGRMMTNEYERLSLLDYALNSVLMLSYVALDQGDSVGMLCFSDHIHRYVPPAGGKRQMNRILHAGFDQFPRMVQSRFDQAFLYLSTHCRRRSLVVLITNVIDQVNAQQIDNYMGNLIGAHLPLVVLLRDHSVFQAADNPSPDPAVLYRSAAAGQLLTWRNQVIHRMKAAGSLALDVFPEDMSSPLVNQYLEIKARHLL